MTDFSTKGHVAAEKDFVSSYLKPGIHVAVIQKIEHTQTPSGSQGLKITFSGKPMKELEGKGQTAETTLWMSEKAWPYTKDRLVIMADKLGVRAKLDAISAGDAKDYAAGLNSAFKGVAGRFKFSGVEIKGKFDSEKGEQKPNWFKAELAAFGFVEPLTVSEADSKLTFDENNDYDMKRLPAIDAAEPSHSHTADAGDASSPWATSN